jgi:hypothetical protein
MSPTSYQAALPRDLEFLIISTLEGVSRFEKCRHEGTKARRVRTKGLGTGGPRRAISIGGGESSLGLPHGFDESGDLLAGLLSPRFFHAAADINCEGMNGADYLADGFGCQAAGGDDGGETVELAAIPRGADGLPVVGNAGPAGPGCVRGFQEKAAEIVEVMRGYIVLPLSEHFGEEVSFDADGLQHDQGFEGGDQLGRFLAVELNRVDTERLGGLPDLIECCINEETDGGHEGADLAEDQPGFVECYVSGGWGVEDHADGIGAAFDGGRRVFRAADPADFDARALHGIARIPASLQER